MGLGDLDQRELLLYMNQQKSPGACAVVEFIGCLFGFSGIGIMYAGNVGLGIVCLLLYWGWLVFWGCSGAFTFGLGLLPIPLWWLLATISAAQTAQAHNARLLRKLSRSGSA